jgi:hypothetical protein
LDKHKTERLSVLLCSPYGGSSKFKVASISGHTPTATLID